MVSICPSILWMLFCALMRAARRYRCRSSPPCEFLTLWMLTNFTPVPVSKASLTHRLPGKRSCSSKATQLNLFLTPFRMPLKGVLSPVPLSYEFGD
ncbi:hypothetical protein B0H10DRAFT_2005667 [Mycena sp. CBHHK59/15]|nr:hypothetical protein B0H10DRAFT_2005667 [Mycena sp. CBHHK59/15]